jgi:hypothetical protein
MKHMFLAIKEHALASNHLVSESAFINIESVLPADSPNRESAAGLILMAAEFSHDHAHERFSAQHGITPLPHPHSGVNLGDHELLTEQHHAILAEAFGAKKSDSVYTLAKKAAKLHPLLGPSVK